MISPCTTEHRSATRLTPDSVIDAVCADPNLLTLEFEAIMAAHYPAPADHPNRRPPRTPPVSTTRQTPPGRPAHPTTTTPEPPGHLSAPQRPQRARQRGPPTRAHRRGLALDPTPPPPERRLRTPTEPAGQSPRTANTPGLSGIRPSPTPPRGGSSPPPQRPPRTPMVTGPPSRTAAVVPRHPRPRSSRPLNQPHQEERRSSSAVLRRRGPCHPTHRCRVHQPGAPPRSAPADRTTRMPMSNRRHPRWGAGGGSECGSGAASTGQSAITRLRWRRCGVLVAGRRSAENALGFRLLLERRRG
jgi:hypothetical protein